MVLRHELYVLVAAILYPLWLIAAGCDYLCHRRTDIEHTAGWRESVLHVLQYVCIAPIVILAALYSMTGVILWGSTLAVLLHTVLAYVDVQYTRRHRLIPPFEQRLHYVLTLLPILAVMVLALLDAGAATSGPVLRAANGPTSWQLWLLAGTAVIGGLPVLEELTRTVRAADPQRATTTPSRAPEETRPVR